MPDFRFPKPERKVKIKNFTRFLACLLVFLLAATAVIVALGNINDNNETEAAVVVTPFVLPPTPTPVPTPPPIEIPDGKTMDKVTIVIDAGHGGEDPGAISPYDDVFYEKDVTLDIAKRVKSHLTDDGINAILTRDSDSRLVNSQKEDLMSRANIANDNDASLFVSIHVNANDVKSPNGMEVYYLNKQAMYDNFDSKRFADIMGKSVKEAAGITFNGTVEDPLSVLRNTKMPAVLVETAYITNKNDFERLKSDEFRENTAIGIAEGIKQALDNIGVFEYEGDLYVFKQAG